jgi:hypothetical protein
MKTYEPDYTKLNHPTITKLAFKKCTDLGLTEFEKWALFDFDYSEWFDHLEFIMSATKEQLQEQVQWEEITDGNGNPVTAESWELSQ